MTFTELYNSTLTLLWHIGWRHGVPLEDAKDLAHDVLLSYLGLKKPVDKPREYVAGAMHYASISYVRRRKRIDFTGLGEELLAPVRSHEAAIHARDIVRRLPPLWEEALWLRYVEDCTVREVALRIGFSVSWTEKILRRAKKRAAELAGEPIDDTARWRVGRTAPRTDTYARRRIIRGHVCPLRGAALPRTPPRLAVLAADGCAPWQVPGELPGADGPLQAPAGAA